MKVCIIGGGPAGLLTGLRLTQNNIDVTLYEEHKEIGVPGHCSGVISVDTIPNDLSILKKTLRSDIRGVKIGVPNIIDLQYKSSKPHAMVIDRIAFDKELAKIYIENGGKLELDSKVKIVNANEGKIKINNEKLDYDLVINASGPRSLLKNIKKKDQILYGLQVDFTDDHYDSEMVEIWIDKKLNSDFFFWCIPGKTGEVRIGSASRLPNLSKTIQKFIKWRFGDKEILRRASGLVCLDGYKDSLIEGKIVHIGDAAGQTKPTTGGGISYSLTAAELLSRTIINQKSDSDLLEYERQWKKDWKSEFNSQLILRDIIYKLDEKAIIEIFKEMKNMNVLPELIEKAHMDKQKTILEIIKRNPKLVSLGVRIAGDMLKKLLIK